MDPELTSSLQLVQGLPTTALPKGLMQDSLGLLQAPTQPQSSGPGAMHQGTSLKHPAELLLKPLRLRHHLQLLNRLISFVAEEHKACQSYSCL